MPHAASVLLADLAGGGHKSVTVVYSDDRCCCREMESLDEFRFDGSWLEYSQALVEAEVPT